MLRHAHAFSIGLAVSLCINGLLARCTGMRWRNQIVMLQQVSGLAAPHGEVRQRKPGIHTFGGDDLAGRAGRSPYRVASMAPIPALVA
jgi:hypothetical protein